MIGVTDMPIKTFVLLTTVTRIPSVFSSVYAASSIADGDVMKGVVVFIVTAAITVVGILAKKQNHACTQQKEECPQQ